ncbi:SDR family oxidoreductase [Oceanibacterium hippocampi]|uniref:Putative short-chain type dehydrogenase/reductase n=1 Tax=Oceanibacterium hippocampi TaxID=745714 RepID=A0A1Y5SD10_9PROT|nr:SDR family oxidoreductase [Oceanibacterium hippocampi]SLN34821.1 Putative short-chain type dehydrogenase/reductase [Oceanibacterium hippocampi]
MTIRLDGRVAIVTGSGQGLGRAHALALAERGARVVVNDPGGALDGSGATHRAADSVVEEIRAAGGEAVAAYESVAEATEAAAIVAKAVETFGRLDILVNNAGILRDKSFQKMDPADFEAVLRVHLLGSAFVSHAAFPLMREQGYGRIVMTTSAAGLYGNFGQANYAAAKMGLIGLMNALKIEGAKYGIKVNTIAPVAATRMGETIFPEAILKRLDPAYVAALVSYFASEACEASGDIVECGAGFYAKVQVIEATGHRFPDVASASPEAIAEHYAAISDMTGARPFATAHDALQKLFAG